MHLRRPHGFTLVEIIVVVVIIGVLAAAGVPAVLKAIKRTSGTPSINNVKQFASAFEQYASELGQWPPDIQEKLVPPSMDGRLSATQWETPLPGGHVYDWDLNVNGVKAAISIRPFAGNNSDPIFLALDTALDDGNTSTGNFRLVNDRYMYILEH